jgi:hypothetical protein
MRYTLLTSDGKLISFFVFACAEAYQKAYGGILFDEAILGAEALDKTSAMV